MTYEILGRGPVDVRYAVDDPDSEGEEAKGVQSGWTKTIEVTSPETLMHMTVYPSADEAPEETVTCRVTLDGKVVDEKSIRRGDSSDVLQCEADIS
ncbi:MAG TPA: MmpS family transport accessory protein [Yinghuangia sp.]|uniref:MmpS family transport accessory protein n=1 Tax=Yinghuangia sp. YIM S10712 TaxID=3436930 RepID=UPI002C95113B|nr:MmpS family transport accessory protein [Yinghuangia sp.]